MNRTKVHDLTAVYVPLGTGDCYVLHKGDMVTGLFLDMIEMTCFAFQIAPRVAAQRWTCSEPDKYGSIDSYGASYSWNYH